MPDVVTDTHGLIWYLEDSPRLSHAARDAFDACDRGESLVYVPTICLVEIIYLQGKGRISSDLMSRLDEELQSGTSSLVLVDLTTEVVNALVQVPRAHVPDLPDRIIAATAPHLGLSLISRDRKIQSSNIATIW
ncbi:MAG: type II toxin-antitoxin system VapC family toxin [Chloroflexi bacterium]|nr:type II toxin-antitoxin system VapC family toxin [Chloroflexota bacterium]